MAPENASAPVGGGARSTELACRALSRILPAESFDVPNLGRPQAVLTEALAAVRRGWSVIPVDPVTKRPDFNLLPVDATGAPTWRPYQGKLATTERVLAWWSAGAAAFAVVTGELSGVIVLDDDSEAKSLRGLHIPITPAATTPRPGRHYFFMHPGGFVSTGEILPGLEIRGDGGYAVLPGGCDRDWVVLCEDACVAEIPEWLNALVHPKWPNQRPFRLLNKDGYSKGDSVGRISPTRSEICPTQSPSVSHLGKLTAENFKSVVRSTSADFALVRLIASESDLPKSAVDKVLFDGRGTTFQCILPGHDESRPSASFWRTNGGDILYRDWHCRGAKDWIPLPDVYASIRSGHEVSLSAPARMTWRLGMLVRQGALTPASVPKRQLPKRAPTFVRIVYKGFLELLGAKWLYSDGDPTAFAWEFAAAWCGVSRSTAGKALTWLRREGFIRKVGVHNRANLYSPAEP